MEIQTVHENLVVAEVLDRWPETIPVFLKYKMDCVGCSMSAFETLSEAAQIYHLPLELFVQDLQNVIQEKLQANNQGAQAITPPAQS